jgi:hypothetical protein
VDGSAGAVTVGVVVVGGTGGVGTVVGRCTLVVGSGTVVEVGKGTVVGR